jgi:PhnB protein
MVSMAKSKKRKIVRKGTSPVRAIPTGFRTVSSYLTVSDGKNAIEFYKKAFGGKEMTRSLTPDGKIMNAQIRIGDSIVMVSDEVPGTLMKSPLTIGASTVTLHIYSKNVDKLWSQALEAGARVVMPLDNQFWGDRYGQLVDPFGHHWSLAQHIKMSAKEMEEKQKAAMAMFSAGEHAVRANAPPGGIG